MSNGKHAWYVHINGSDDADAAAADDDDEEEDDDDDDGSQYRVWISIAS